MRPFVDSQMKEEHDGPVDKPDAPCNLFWARKRVVEKTRQVAVVARAATH